MRWQAQKGGTKFVRSAWKNTLTVYITPDGWKWHVIHRNTGKQDSSRLTFATAKQAMADFQRRSGGAA